MNPFHSIKDFDLNLIKTLDAVIREGNASKASKYLQVTPAAVSMALRRLQATYNEVLFVRTKEGLAPTAKAVELHSAFSQAIGIVDATFDTGKNKQKQGITIYGSDIIEPLYLSKTIGLDLFGQYLITHRSFWEHDARRIKEILISGSADIVLSFDPIDDGQLNTAEVESFTQYCVICSNRNPLADAAKLSLYNLFAFHHVVYTNDRLNRSLKEKYALFQNLLDPFGQRKILFRSDSITGMINMVENSSMIAVIPSRLARFFKEKKQCAISLLPLPDEIKLKPLRLYAYWSKDNLLIDDIELIVATLQSAASFNR
ncbi:LysR family transcriptional regulator [Enterobacteriaceae bacterium 89]|nr:LysR family transcriptional regulator [Enterobacteriaceae bacterium 89]